MDPNVWSVIRKDCAFPRFGVRDQPTSFLRGSPPCSARRRVHASTLVETHGQRAPPHGGTSRADTTQPTRIFLARALPKALSGHSRALLPRCPHSHLSLHSSVESSHGAGFPATHDAFPRHLQRWRKVGDIDCSAGSLPLHDWCITSLVSQRVLPGVYTLLALSRYRQALMIHTPLAPPTTYPPLVPKFLTTCFEVIFCPPRRLREQKPCAADVFHALAIFLQVRDLFPQILLGHDCPGSLLLTPRLDAKMLFGQAHCRHWVVASY